MTTQAGQAPVLRDDEFPDNPWPALWALVVGFFMILVDVSIVSIATPALMESFDAGIEPVLWVTSAYLLAYAVPLLITGRFGDRYGPKRLYLTGLAIFTLASLACGLAPTIGWLIGARVVQGLGASMMTPQTMAVITRTFPPARRGSAMALWGATAGVAFLVGPLLGGLLLDSWGWSGSSSSTCRWGSSASSRRPVSCPSCSGTPTRWTGWASACRPSASSS